MELFLGDVCCKLESLWAWDIAAHDLPTWREVFSVSDWDTMTPKYVFPSLASHYAKSSASIHTLKTRPHQSAFLRGCSFLVAQSLLTAEFFPKWLVHIRLVRPRPNFDEGVRMFSEVLALASRVDCNL
jgi:hypothetical protein